ncbi:MAG: polyphosphate kinase 2 family protein [Paludisphaera borealis]|uniref:polyphosphate kinase 2 family protein n=1 Tax=Paludisphaera borealis TaxID=1387353 RepID=UPI00283F17DB|nr:polyphosphate kinase 2 family protein [Paludisphaera borealis]MDR3621704.1 polyphosphate kinase 2 family protein [Paludisphaera borealis]
MITPKEIVAMCRVDHDKTFRLKDHDPAWAGDPDVAKDQRKKFAEETLSQDVSDLAEAQQRLYASDSWSLLIIFQAMDAAGKDSTIKHVMSGVNPQGCQVFSFKHPSAEELDHNFLWRYTKAMPERGRIGIFNRSYYEEVLVVRVHSELVQAERIPAAKVDDDFWDDRFEDINALERHLSRNGTRVLKFFLNLSKDEQRKRFLKRLEEPSKNWKYSAADLAERAYWDDYMKAYEEAIRATSTKWAPWHVIPADHKWVARSIVARTIVEAVNAIDPQYPEIEPQDLEAIRAAEKQLKDEGKSKGKDKDKDKDKNKRDED